MCTVKVFFLKEFHVLIKFYYSFKMAIYSHYKQVTITTYIVNSELRKLLSAYFCSIFSLKEKCVNKNNIIVQTVFIVIVLTLFDIRICC